MKLMSGQDFQDMIETPQEKPKDPLKPRERKMYVDDGVEDDDKDETYVPSGDEDEDEYMSDISIQSEY